MKDILTVSNQKGGVGKSTTVNALGAGLYLKGYKVLYIDMDAQSNLSSSLQASDRAVTILEVLTGKATAQEAILETPQGDIIPASRNLSEADTIITGKGKEYRLKEAIEPIKDNYDYIIIDTPPALGVLTINALTACKSVIIPTQADIYSLEGLGQLSQTISTVKKYCNNDITIKGVLVTRYDTRTKLTKDMVTLLEQTAEQLNTKVYNTKIKEYVAYKEAQAMRQDLFTYDAKSKASKNFQEFIDEYTAQ